MPRAFCSECGAEVPVAEDGRCYVGHTVDITTDGSLSSVAQQAASTYAVSDEDDEDLRYDLNRIGGRDPSRTEEEDDELLDVSDQFDISSLEAAVAELGFNREDLAAVPSDLPEELPGIDDSTTAGPDTPDPRDTTGDAPDAPDASVDADAPADDAPDADDLPGRAHVEHLEAIEEVRALARDYDAEPSFPASEPDADEAEDAADTADESAGGAGRIHAGHDEPPEDPEDDEDDALPGPQDQDEGPSTPDTGDAPPVDLANFTAKGSGTAKRRGGLFRRR